MSCFVKAIENCNESILEICFIGRFVIGILFLDYVSFADASTPMLGLDRKMQNTISNKIISKFLIQFKLILPSDVQKESIHFGLSVCSIITPERIDEWKRKDELCASVS